MLVALVGACSTSGEENAGRAAGAPCSVTDSPIPTSAVDQTPIAVDIDADGAADTVTGYRLDESWFLQTRLATGAETTMQIETGLVDNWAIPDRAVVMGGETLVIALVGTSQVGGVHGFFAWRECALEPVLTQSGEYPGIWIGGGADHHDWFSCDLDGVTQLIASDIVGTDGRGRVQRAQWTFDATVPAFVDPVASEETYNPPVSVDLLFETFPDCVE